MEIEQLIKGVAGVLRVEDGERFYEIKGEAEKNTRDEVDAREKILDNLLKISSLPQVWAAMCFSAMGDVNSQSWDDGSAQHMLKNYLEDLSETAIRLMPYELDAKKGYIVLKIAVNRDGGSGEQEVRGSILVFEEQDGQTKNSPVPVTIKNLAPDKYSDAHLMTFVTRNSESFKKLLESFSVLFEKTNEIAVPYFNQAVRTNKEQREKSKKTLGETLKLSDSIINLLPTELKHPRN